jgi:hypothetical protein
LSIFLKKQCFDNMYQYFSVFWVTAGDIFVKFLAKRSSWKKLFFDKTFCTNWCILSRKRRYFSQFFGRNNLKFLTLSPVCSTTLYNWALRSRG